MLKIGVVGDLSGGDPYRYGKVLHAAMTTADVVVQVGDLHPAYDLSQEGFASGKVFLCRGNHDVSWKPEWPLQWRKDFPEATLIGIDNSSDVISQAGWDILDGIYKDGHPKNVFVFAHKSPVPLVLPDGSISTHIMGEGSASPDANRLVKWLNMMQGTATIVCGHLHSWSLQKTQDFDLILDGRGGAAPELAFSLILVSQDTWVMHSVPVS
jgi:predicted phosphodiesterase